jgi:hypothetical protein
MVHAASRAQDACMSMISSLRHYQRPLPLTTLVIAASLLLVEALAVGGMLALVRTSPADPGRRVRVSQQADSYAVYDQVVAGSTGPLTAQQSRLIEGIGGDLVQPCSPNGGRQHEC